MLQALDDGGSVRSVLKATVVVGALRVLSPINGDENNFHNENRQIHLIGRSFANKLQKNEQTLATFEKKPEVNMRPDDIYSRPCQ